MRVNKNEPQCSFIHIYRGPSFDVKWSTPEVDAIIMHVLIMLLSSALLLLQWVLTSHLTCLRYEKPFIKLEIAVSDYRNGNMY